MFEEELSDTFVSEDESEDLDIDDGSLNDDDTDEFGDDDEEDDPDNEYH